MTKITLYPSPEDLAYLPKNAQLALSARCVCRVLPMIEIAWPEIPWGDLEEINAVADMIELSSSQTVDLSGRSQRMTAILNRCCNVPARKALCVIVDAAWGKPKLVESVVASASHMAPYMSNANATFAARDEVMLAIWADFEQLVSLSEEGDWNDATVVKSKVLGPLWQNGQPDWFFASSPEYVRSTAEDVEPLVPVCNVRRASRDLSDSIRDSLTLTKADKKERRKHMFRGPAAAHEIAEALGNPDDCQTLNELREFYARHNGAELFATSKNQSWPLGIDILPVQWIAPELNRMLHWDCTRVWFEQRVVDEENDYMCKIASGPIEPDEKFRLVQFTKNDIVVFAGQRMGADRWFCVTLAGR